MRKIICRDSCILTHAPEEVFAAVADVGVYSEWWGGVKVKVIDRQPEFIGSKVEIKSNGGKFCCEITGFVPCKQVDVNYYDGVVRGKGVWLLEKLSADSCRLHYNIDLVPFGLFPRLLSGVMDFSSMHSRTIKVMFASLADYLKRENKNVL